MCGVNHTCRWSIFVKWNWWKRMRGRKTVHQKKKPQGNTGWEWLVTGVSCISNAVTWMPLLYLAMSSIFSPTAVLRCHSRRRICCKKGKRRSLTVTAGWLHTGIKIGTSIGKSTDSAFVPKMIRKRDRREEHCSVLKHNVNVYQNQSSKYIYAIQFSLLKLIPIWREQLIYSLVCFGMLFGRERTDTKIQGGALPRGPNFCWRISVILRTRYASGGIYQ